MEQSQQNTVPDWLQFPVLTEKGNNAFIEPHSGGCAFFAELAPGIWFQAGYTPPNYPAWQINTIEASDAVIIAHIQKRLAGWYCLKCQFEEIILDSDDCVCDEDTGAELKAARAREEEMKNAD